MLKRKNDERPAPDVNTIMPSRFDGALQQAALLLCLIGAVMVIGFAVYRLAHPVAPFAFPLPTDACLVNGALRILSQNTSARTQTYVRADGATVTTMYGMNDLTGDVYERGSDIWFGEACTVQGVKGNG